MDSVGTHNVLRVDTPPTKEQHLHQHFIPGWLKKDFKNYLDPCDGKYTFKKYNLTKYIKYPNNTNFREVVHCGAWIKPQYY